MRILKLLKLPLLVCATEVLAIDGNPVTDWANAGWLTNHDNVSLHSRMAFTESTVTHINEHGEALVAGPCTVFPHPDFLICVVRFTADATLDSGFGDEGLMIHHYPLSRWIAAMNSDSSGTVYLAGSNHSSMTAYVIRIRSDGMQSNEYPVAFVPNIGGPYSGNRITALQIDSEDRLVLGGSALMSLWEGVPAFTRLDFSDPGLVDPSFGELGVTLIEELSGHAWVKEMKIDADGRILASGWTSSDPGLHTTAGFVLRLGKNGALDDTFAGGIYIDQDVGFDDAQRFIAGLAVDSAGRAVVAGQKVNTVGDGSSRVIRLTSSGELDSSFGEGGEAIFNLSGATNPSETAELVAVAASGKILVGGISLEYGDWGLYPPFALTRHHSDGSVDEQFGRGGRTLMQVLPDQCPCYSTMSSFEVFEDELIIGGSYYGAASFFKLNLDTILDGTFEIISSTR